MCLIARGYTRGFCFCICTLVVGLDYYWDFIREAILLLSIAKYIRGVLRLIFSEPPYSIYVIYAFVDDLLGADSTLD